MEIIMGCSPPPENYEILFLLHLPQLIKCFHLLTLRPPGKMKRRRQWFLVISTRCNHRLFYSFPHCIDCHPKSNFHLRLGARKFCESSKLFLRTQNKEGNCIHKSSVIIIIIIINHSSSLPVIINQHNDLCQY